MTLGNMPAISDVSDLQKSAKPKVLNPELCWSAAPKKLICKLCIRPNDRINNVLTHLRHKLFVGDLTIFILCGKREVQAHERPLAFLPVSINVQSDCLLDQLVPIVSYRRSMPDIDFS